MSAFTIFVRSLGGRCRACEVTDDTSIESLLRQHWEHERVPAFYQVRLYHANMELGVLLHSEIMLLAHGTVGEAGLAQGSELSAIVSIPEQHKHMQTIIGLRASRRLQAEHCADAVRFLGTYPALERATIDSLLDILLHGSHCNSAATHPIGIAVGEVFGRICDPAADYIPRLIGHIPCAEAIIALNEIDVRGEFPRKQKTKLLRQWFHSGWPEFSCHESLLALARLVSRTSNSDLWMSLKYHLDVMADPPVDEDVYTEVMTILGLHPSWDAEDFFAEGIHLC
jgi:hypothetical protein